MIFMANSYDIVHYNGHYEVYVDGEFFCSADTHLEAVREIDTIA